MGSKSLAQMPAHRNGPVSSNVKPDRQRQRRPKIAREQPKSRENTSIGTLLANAHFCTIKKHLFGRQRARTLDGLLNSKPS